MAGVHKTVNRHNGFICRACYYIIFLHMVIHKIDKPEFEGAMK